MDQDGANNKFLTLGNELVLTPRFNPHKSNGYIFVVLQKFTKSISVRY
jgi:Tol biopolymer transport system component